MQHTIASAELTNGSTVSARVGIATKIAWEKAAKANGWTAEDNPFTVNQFWAWHATRAAGHHDLDYAAFVTQVVDVDLARNDPTDPDGDDDPDPTRQAAGTAPLSS